MKIAMLTDRLALGGGPECIRLIARYLPGHEYTVFAGSGTLPALEKLPNVRVVRSFPGRKELEKFDLVHCHHLRPLARLRVPAGLPVINTVHGVHSRKFEYKSGLGNAVRGVFRRSLERRLFAGVTVNIALTSDDRDWLKVHYRLDNLAVIPNGVETDMLPPADPGALYRELGLPESKHLLLMIGRFDFLKGYDILFEAVKCSADSLRRNSVIIALIGDGEERPRFERMARKHSLGDTLFFCGGRSEAKRFLPLADGLLLPSRWEGLPLVALEAGICGVPVIGAAVPGIASLLEEGRTGRLFPAEDAAALAKLLADETLFDVLSTMGQAWREDVLNHYGVERMTAALDALYRTVVHNSNERKLF